ncbi:unnamed protein product, partial [Effrenium voratum]
FDNDLQDLELLLKVFPCAKVVLSYRKELEDQLLSQSYALGDFQWYVTVEANQAMENFAARHPEKTFSLALEDFGVERFNQLLGFLGEDACRYVRMLHDN